MKCYKVYFQPDAIADLTSIYEFIATESGMPEVAWSYIQKLQRKCDNLTTAPLRGQRRDDLRSNLRIMAIDKNAVVAFEVEEERQMVTVLNIFYGGQDYEVIMGNA